MKVQRHVQVINTLGLHTRPAAMIVKLLQNSQSQVTFTYKKETVNAKSILSILMLAASRHSKIVIEADGVDAQETVEQLVDIFEKGFHE